MHSQPYINYQLDAPIITYL